MVEVPTNTCSIRGRYVPKRCNALYLVAASQIRSGELLFIGNECRNYTVPNDSDATRVSFDFRVIPRSLYRGDFDGFIGEYKTAVCEGPLEDLVRAGPAAVGEEVVAHR